MKTMMRNLLLATCVGAAAVAATGVAYADSVAHGDASFLKNAAEAGSMEVEGSQLALNKASSADVKSFAQQMIDDHTKAAQDLSALASSKGVKLPEGPSITQKAKLKLLGTHEGAKFDADYAKSVGVKAHEDAVKLFTKASTDAKDADVKAFAAKTLPTLQHHLEMARELQAKTGKS